MMSSSQPGQGPQALSGPKVRRAHHKSRKGCFNCRKRRVKCDEQHPICRSCGRREVQCEWPEELSTPFQSFRASGNSYAEKLADTTSRPWRDNSHDAQGRAHVPPCAALLGDPAVEVSLKSVESIPPDAKASCQSLELNDLALMHHWTISTSVQSGVPKSHVEFFQRTIPDVAFTHPFVSHAILSVAALHMAHLSTVGRKQNIIHAIQHHNASLPGFRKAVADINKENSEALFIWSALNSLYMLSLTTQGPHQVLDRADRILGVEWIPMLQGVTTVLHPILEHLQNGRLKDVVTLQGWKGLDPEKPIGTWLGIPLSRLQESWAGSHNAATYDDTLSVLRKCILFVGQFDGMDEETLSQCGYNRALSGSLVFIHASPRKYFTLLHQRQPPALILFAYFGMLLHGQRDCWVIDHLGQEIIDVVNELVSGHWRSLLPTGTDLLRTPTFQSHYRAERDEEVGAASVKSSMGL